MKIETKRLILRDLKKTDAKDIRENVNNKNVSEHLLVVPYPYSIKDANWFINNCIKKSKKKPREGYNFGITLRNENKVIGIIGLDKVNKYEGTAGIGYWLGEKYWRQGIMAESFKEILIFAFSDLKLRRINICAYADNLASNSLIKKMGFKYEGTRRKVHRDKATGKIHDEHIYGMLRGEWKSK